MNVTAAENVRTGNDEQSMHSRWARSSSLQQPTVTYLCNGVVTVKQLSNPSGLDFVVLTGWFCSLNQADHHQHAHDHE